MRELLQHSKKPLLNSHSNVNTLHEHPRNIPDDIIDLFAKNGGVMGISIYSPFITTSGTATIDQYVDQVAYVVNRIGDDHVAFGTDWHGIPKSKTIAGLDSVN